MARDTTSNGLYSRIETSLTRGGHRRGAGILNSSVLKSLFVIFGVLLTTHQVEATDEVMDMAPIADLMAEIELRSSYSALLDKLNMDIPYGGSQQTPTGDQQRRLQQRNPLQEGPIQPKNKPPASSTIREDSQSYDVITTSEVHPNPDDKLDTDTSTIQNIHIAISDPDPVSEQEAPMGMSQRATFPDIRGYTGRRPLSMQPDPLQPPGNLHRPHNRQHREAAGEQTLSRQKRITSPAKFSEPDYRGDSTSKQSKRSTQQQQQQQPQQPISAKQLSRLESDLLQRVRSEPEHKHYNDDLFIRRMKVLLMDNKHNRKNRLPVESVEDEDSWQQELRIRQELAQKAVQYGLEMRKERLAHPGPDREPSILDRIKHDAAEILTRRAREEQYARKGIKSPHATNASRSPTPQAPPGADEERQENKANSKDHRKSDKNVRHHLKENGVSLTFNPSDRKTGVDEGTGENGSQVTPSSERSDSLGFQTFTEDMTARRKDRRKMKSRSRALVRALSLKKRAQLL